MKKLKSLAILFTLFLPVLSSGNTAPRHVLAVWSSQDDENLIFAPIHRNIESVFNHLGYIVDHVDINSNSYEKLIGRLNSKKYQAVVSAFRTENVTDAEKWFRFIQTATQNGVGWISFLRLGFLKAIHYNKAVSFFSSLGVVHSYLESLPFVIKADKKDPTYLDFERVLSQPIREFPLFELKKGAIFLSLQGKSARIKSTPVFSSEKWSLAYGPFGLSKGPRGYAWTVNPYLFLRKALSIPDNMPIADVSVINGARTFYTHIDGDGANSISRIDELKYTSDIFEEKLFKKYPDLPFGVSYIISEIDPKFHGSDRVRESAKRILKRNNVEPASHTFFHPLNWKEGKLSFEKFLKYSVKRETLTSIAYLDRHILDSDTKKTKVLYWSGNCLPEREAFRLLAKNDLLNINGGDGRWDTEFPSRAYLSPLGRQHGKYFQVYSSNANDNIFTNGWTGPYYGFRKVIETFRNTSAPDILNPINPYFHFFSGERKIGLEAIFESIDWALKNEIAPIFPSQHIRAVLAFQNLKVRKISENSFLLSQVRNISSFRLPSSINLYPDFSRSQNIIGFRKINRSHYFFLKPGVDNAKLVLTKNTPQQPFLKYLGGALVKAEYNTEKLYFELAPFARSPLIVSASKKIFKTARVSLNGKSVLFKVVGDELRINFKTNVNAQIVEILL